MTLSFRSSVELLSGQKAVIYFSGAGVFHVFYSGQLYSTMNSFSLSLFLNQEHVVCKRFDLTGISAWEYYWPISESKKYQSIPGMIS